MRARLINGFLIFLSVTVVLNLIRSWSQLHQRGDILKREQHRLEAARAQEEQLGRRLAQVETQAYQEKLARERLNAAKPQEAVILLPSLPPIILYTPTPTPLPPTWQQWKQVFIY